MKGNQQHLTTQVTQLLWVCCWLIFFGALTGTAAAQSPTPIPEDAFWQLLADTRTAIQKMRSESPETQRERLDDLAAELKSVTAVSRTDGQVIPVDLTFFAGLLQAESPHLDRIDAQLQTLLDTHSRWPEAQFDGSETAVLTDILSQPEFQYETAAPTWLEKQRRTLMARLQEFISNILPADPGTGSSGVGSTILTIVISLIVATILITIINDLVADFAGEARLATEDTANGEPLTADAALQRAQIFSGAGDYRTAVRYLYLSALLLLEERDLLRYDRSLTNREYLKSIAHLPDLSAILHDVIDVFDRVWYGFQPVDEPTYQRYVQQVNQLKKQRRSG